MIDHVAEEDIAYWDFVSDPFFKKNPGLGVQVIENNHDKGTDIEETTIYCGNQISLT